MVQRTARKTLKPRPRRDWKLLLDWEIHTFRKGKDFRNAKTLRVSAHRAAKRLGVKAITKAQESGDIEIQFTDPKQDN